MSQEHIADSVGKKSDSNGDQRALDFNTRRVLGYYKAAHNHTTDAFGYIIAKGNCLAALIYKNK